MLNSGLFTGTTDLWETPQDFYDSVKFPSMLVIFKGR